MSLKVEFLYSPDCPHAPGALKLLQDVVQTHFPGTKINETAVETMAQATTLRFPGSPTMMVNGQDLEGSRAPPEPALACRLYQASSSGVPPRWLVEAALLRALAPRHILFLCVANSARSQLAEGIARQRAPPGTRIESAGSGPTSVRPEVLTLLKEVGFNPSTLRSKGLADPALDLDQVEAVITLCDRMVCPAFPRPVPKLHWALSDPAAVEGSERERLAAFRRVREELERRLGYLFDRTL